MSELWTGIVIGSGVSLSVAAIVWLTGTIIRLFTIPRELAAVKRGLEIVLNGELANAKITFSVLEVQQATLEFIREGRNNGNITSAIDKNKAALAECAELEESTQQFLLKEFSGVKR